MAIETLGEALNLSWRIDMRCLERGQEMIKRQRECDYRGTLHMETLVCTRGRDFPLDQLASRLRCPRCGSRNVRVMYSSPTTVKAARQ